MLLIIDSLTLDKDFKPVEHDGREENDCSFLDVPCNILWSVFFQRPVCFKKLETHRNACSIS